MEIAIVFYIILAGVIIYVAGEIIVKIVIDPVQELKRVIADIAFKLIHYSHIYRITPSGDVDASGEEAQKLYAEANYEYPVNPKVEPSELLKSWGSFKEQEIPLNVLGNFNTDAVRLFGEVGWK